MSAQVWMVIGIVGFSLAAVFILVAVLLFVRYNIPAVLGELTGRTEKRQVEKMRRAKADAANKVHALPRGYEREMMAAASPASAPKVEITDVLEERVEVLGTEQLAGTTDLLIEEDLNATTLLSGNDAPAQPFEAARSGRRVDFRIVKSVVVVHTSEFLE